MCYTVDNHRQKLCSSFLPTFALNYIITSKAFSLSWNQKKKTLTLRVIIWTLSLADYLPRPSMVCTLIICVLCTHVQWQCTVRVHLDITHLPSSLNPLRGPSLSLCPLHYPLVHPWWLENHQKWEVDKRAVIVSIQPLPHSSPDVVS